ncbi:MAG: hypoxanthine phosphoribosyltransferase [Endomicrobia bacterium]|nr:hypoxanthine phosphoribosyltransferase [Endomicrobiia bacterium]MCL2799763.1 hypoxanthine phosphoribosyltransferase [Endomicrobiia bacterium]
MDTCFRRYDNLVDDRQMTKENKRIIEVLFSKDTIDKRVSETAELILREYKGKKPLIIGVLKGSFIFCADLIRKLKFDCQVDFITLNSYSGASSGGKIKLISNLKERVENRDVIIVEDIVDTGITLDFLLKQLHLQKPKSVKTCVLLDKKPARIKEVPVEYVCFEVGKEFVVGYGLDYKGFYRNLSYIGILKNSKAKKRGN